MALLEAEQVVMRFGGVVALDNASVDVDPGEVTGLIGPNGAGKTTLFNVVTGLLPPTSGTVKFDGVDITRAGVSRRSQMGIARTFQKLEAFNTLSAFDNVRVAVEKNHRAKWKHQRVSDVAHEMLGKVGLDDVADVTVGTLPTGSARLVELARASGLSAPGAAFGRAVVWSERRGDHCHRPTAVGVGGRQGQRSGRSAGGARHELCDGGVCPHPCAGLRQDHRGGHAY